MWGSKPLMWGSEPLMWGLEVSFANNGVRRSEMWGSPSLPPSPSLDQLFFIIFILNALARVLFPGIITG